jgi:hypothetical protein
LAARLTGGSSGGGSSSSSGSSSGSSSTGTIQRTPAPSIQRNASSSGTVQRALGDDGGGGSTGVGGDFPYDLTAVDRRRLVQWLVDNLGDRMLEELERRGGRFRGEF